MNQTNIQLVFGLDRDIDGAARDVQAAIVASRVDLPASLRTNPQYHKQNQANGPIIVLALSSNVLTPGQVYDAAATIVQQKLSQVKGVGVVNVNGSALPAVRVELNPTTLFKYGIGLEDVRAAISATNANAPKGAIENGQEHWQIYTNDQADRAAQYRSLIVAYRNGAPVRLSDLGEVLDKENGATENVRNFGLFQGEPAVFAFVQQQPGANIIETIGLIKALLPEIRASIDPKIDLTVQNDRSVTIRASLRQVEHVLFLAVALVILVVFIFLRNPRAAIIPLVAVPISLIGSFGVMYLLGFSLDNLSLMSLTIATGFVVDDAIVVLENTTRHVEAGMGRIEAALLGAQEVGFTVVSMSLSLIAVFLPLQMTGGVIGSLFREFTITLSVAILISLAVSLTTTPMMCSKLLGRGAPPDWRLLRWSEAAFLASRNAYERSLSWAIERKPLMLSVLLLTIALSVYLYTIIPKTFFPQQDTGMLQGAIRADQSTSFQTMQQKMTEAAAIIQKDPAVDQATAMVGGGFGGGATGSVMVALKPISERSESADHVIARLRPKLLALRGVSTFMQSMQDIRIGGRQANSQYQYTMQADDLPSLQFWSEKLRQALQNVPEVTDVDSDQQPGGLEKDVIVDRDAAYAYGLTESQIDNTLYDAFGQRLVSTNYGALNQYHVVMEVAPEYWQDPEVLKDIFISTASGQPSGTQLTNAVAGTVTVATKAPTSAVAANALAVANDTARNLAANQLANSGRGAASSGAAVSSVKETMVPLSAFARFADSTTPTTVNHQGSSIATTIAFNLPEGESLSTAVAAINRAMNLLGAPVTVRGSFQGTAQTFLNSLSREPLLLLASLVVVYIVLGILYESLIHPITIISTLPSAGVGAFMALLVTGTSFSLIAFIGILLLIGLVKKNGIMLVDFAITGERELNLTPEAAIKRACLLRFRPIMMTTFAAIFGAIPLALAAGDGTELRRPLGIAIVGGLLLSQILTLYTTPVVYLYIDRLRRWKSLRAMKDLALKASPGTAEVGAE